MARAAPKTPRASRRYAPAPDRLLPHAEECKSMRRKNLIALAGVPAPGAAPAVAHRALGIVLVAALVAATGPGVA
jgi:hypothetical protein